MARKEIKNDPPGPPEGGVGSTRSQDACPPGYKKPVDPDLFFQQEPSPYQPDKIETGRGSLPAFIRYLPHAIILWSVGYVLYQAESNYLNYLTAALLVLWSGYNLIAVKKKWPPFP